MKFWDKIKKYLLGANPDNNSSKNEPLLWVSRVFILIAYICVLIYLRTYVLKLPSYDMFQPEIRQLSKQPSTVLLRQRNHR